jgi:SAM-dependent methyltransferase
MSERLTKCPLCKSGLFLNHEEIKDYAVSGESFILCICQNCGLKFTNPRPTESAIGPYYQSEDYISHQDKSTNIINLLYKTVRLITTKKKLSWLNKYHNSKGNLLDMGCGTGYFLHKANEDGWKTTGIEPNKAARKLAKSKGLYVRQELKDLDQKIKYDVISLFHVLEHIHHLRKTTKRLLKLLNNGGILMIAVPNNQSFDSIHYGTKWASLDVPRHLYHFTPESIGNFATLFDLEIIGQEPMIFDSYYVAMLSEKYNGKAPLKALLSGLWIGLQSNLRAKNNKNHFSSILFILKKK